MTDPAFIGTRIAALSARRVTTVAAFSVAVVALMQFPAPAGSSLDDSWQLILADAFIRHLTYGRDLVFTFGPLGALENHVQLPALLWPQMIWQVATRSVALALLAWWSNPTGRLAQGLIFCLVMVTFSTSETGIPANDAFLMLAIWVAGAVLIIDGAKSRWLTIGSVVLLAALSLVKISYATTGVIAIVSALLCLTLKQEIIRGAAIVFGFVGLWIAGWFLCGQPLGAIPDFVRGAIEIVAGYSDAMMSPNVPLRSLTLAAVAAAMLIALTLYQGSRTRDKSVAASLIVLTTTLLLVAWRHSTVRADIYHLSGFFGWIALVALLWLSVASRTDITARTSVLPNLTVWGLVLLAGVVSFRTKTLITDKGRDFYRDLRQAGRWVLRPQLTRELWEVRYEAAQQAVQLPLVHAIVGRSGLDIEGYRQAYGILGGYHFLPRPIPQSYHAYTPALAARNAKWLAANPPPFTLLRIESIDDRLPALDDAPALRWLLQNERVLLRSGEFLLLAPDARPPLAHRDLEQHTPLRLAEWHLFTNPGEHELRYLKIEMFLSLGGRIVGAFLPLHPLRLEVKFVNGRIETFNLPIQMARTGFLLNPLVRSNADVFHWMEKGTAEAVIALRVMSPTAPWIYRPNGSLSLLCSTSVSGSDHPPQP